MKKLLLFILALSPAISVAGEYLDKLERRGITVRKSFVGTLKDSTSPAEISYQNPDDGRTSYKIDIAMRYKLIDWYSGDLRLSPVFEHHRNSQESKETDKTSAGITLEHDYGFGTCKAASGRVIESCNTVLSDIAWKLDRDSQNDTTTRIISFKTGLNTGYRFAPGWTLRTDNLEFTYYPTIGIEAYEKLAIKSKNDDGDEIEEAPLVDETFGFLRISTTFKPWPKLLSRKLEANISYTNRKLFGSSDVISDNNELIEASLDWYFDQKERIGIGLSYQNGRNPNRNFLDEESSSIGIKFKL